MIPCSGNWSAAMVADQTSSSGVYFEQTASPSTVDCRNCNSGTFYTSFSLTSPTIQNMSITSNGCNGNINPNFSKSSFLHWWQPRILTCIFYSSFKEPSASTVGSQCMFTNCDSSPCTAGLNCTDYINYYTCTSPSYCTSNPCAHGTCISGTSNYTCNCTGSGYTGTNCTTGTIFSFYLVIRFPFFFFFSLFDDLFLLFLLLILQLWIVLLIRAPRMQHGRRLCQPQRRAAPATAAIITPLVLLDVLALKMEPLRPGVQ